jgi:hypothetical protein
MTREEQIMKIIFALMLSAVGLFAADATGTWTGTLTRTGGETGPAHLVLKQDGEKVTGSAGPGAEEQHDIQEGKSAGGKITFEIPRENGAMKFVLTQEGDQIKGTVSMERDGEVQSGELVVSRTK